MVTVGIHVHLLLRASRFPMSASHEQVEFLNLEFCLTEAPKKRLKQQTSGSIYIFDIHLSVNALIFS